MNFRDLEYVIQTAKTLNFSKAAEICNVSQPSLSTQIKKLEKLLGAEIFIRNKKQVHLTAFGKTFVKHAKEILEIREEIYRAANKNHNPLEGRLKLGAILTIAPYFFPNIVKMLHKKAPKIKLTLKEAKTEELISDLLKEKIDAAIISLPTDEHIFEKQKLFTEEFFIAVSKQHPLAKKKVISKEDLNNQELTLLEEGHCFRSQSLEVCQTSDAKENQIFTATSLETIRHFIALGESMTLMPKMACVEDNKIKYIPLENKKFSRDIGIIWRKNSNKKLQIEKLISLIAE